MELDIDAYWRDFTFSLPEATPDFCAVAATFAAWVGKLIAQAQQKGTLDIDAYWRDFTFSLPEATPDFCAVAATFAAWVGKLIAQAQQKGTEEYCTKALLLLQARFWECYRELPSKHQKRIGKPDHTCIFQVYEQAYLGLRSLRPSTLLPKEERPAPLMPYQQPRWQFFGDPVTEDEE